MYEAGSEEQRLSTTGGIEEVVREYGVVGSRRVLQAGGLELVL
jgi:hypothetical protein